MAPVSGYYGGHGEAVMSNMTKEYGAEKGKRVFYATANKRKMKPPVSHKPAGAPGKNGKWGDVSILRGAENSAAGGYNHGREVPSTYLPVREIQLPK